MLFLGIISWNGALYFNGGGGVFFRLGGGGFIFKWGVRPMGGIGFDGGQFSKKNRRMRGGRAQDECTQ